MIVTKKDGGSEMKGKSTIKKARETVLAAGKSAAQRTKVLAGEVANAAATASAAAASAVLDTVATAIQARAVKGANAHAGEGTTTVSPAKKRVAKRVPAKKRAAPKTKAKKKKASRKPAKKK